MTLLRITEFKDILFNKGFSDIYIFDFTGIGGRGKDNKENPGVNIQNKVDNINDMYKLISGHLTKYIELNFKNFSILGRSAGGGLSLQMVFLHGLVSIGLNVASPGYSYDGIKDGIINYTGDRKLPIRVCWAKEDKKNPETQPEKGNDGVNLKKILNDNEFVNFKYYSKSVGSDDDKITHRILPILIENLV